MRVLDRNGNALTSPDLTKGYLEEERILIARHEAVPGTPAKGHYETVRTYPNGGKDVRFVTDQPGMENREAWEEYETILRYTEYSLEQLEMVNARTHAQRIADLEEALEMILSEVTE